MCSSTMSAVMILVQDAGGRRRSGALDQRTVPLCASTRIAPSALTSGRTVPEEVVPGGSPAQDRRMATDPNARQRAATKHEEEGARPGQVRRTAWNPVSYTHLTLPTIYS